jgi:hypothetical protein
MLLSAKLMTLRRTFTLPPYLGHPWGYFFFKPDLRQPQHIR